MKLDSWKKKGLITFFSLDLLVGLLVRNFDFINSYYFLSGPRSIQIPSYFAYFLGSWVFVFLYTFIFYKILKTHLVNDKVESVTAFLAGWWMGTTTAYGYAVTLSWTTFFYLLLADLMKFVLLIGLWSLFRSLFRKKEYKNKF